MSGKKISQLPVITTPSLTGVTAVVDNGVTYKISLSDLQTLILTKDNFLTGGTISGNTISINFSNGEPVYITGLTNNGVYSDGTITFNSGDQETFSVTGLSNPFLYNKTRVGLSNIIKETESIFNPTNLVVLSGTTFVIENDAEYYVLGDLTNNGSMVVNGTLKIDGVLYNQGDITGSGTII
jgi:hypothetical protein